MKNRDIQRFYAYTYYDTARAEFIYVGKGRDERAWAHLRSTRVSEFNNRVRKMIREGNPPRISLYGGMDNELACLVEQELIALYGRKDLGTGTLLNLTDGGEGTPGRVCTPEFSENMSKAKRGKKHTPEARENYRLAALRRTYTAERNENVSKGLTGHTTTIETRAKMGRTMQGAKNPMFGRKHSPETLTKLRQAALNRSKKVCYERI